MRLKYSLYFPDILGKANYLCLNLNPPHCASLSLIVFQTEIFNSHKLKSNEKVSIYIISCCLCFMRST